MKKKRLTINSLAGSNLRKRKGQYVLMIIGIILAMVFSSSVLFFISCMNTSLDEIKKNSVGAHKLFYVDASDELMQAAADKGVDFDYCYAHVVGSVYSETDGKSNLVSVARLDEKTKEVSYISFIEGRYPQNENEIALEKTSYLMLCPDAKTGDTIKLKMLVQNGKDFLEEPVEKSYKLVGIARNKKSNLDDASRAMDFIPSAFVSDSSVIDAGGREMLVAYITENRNKRDLSAETFYGVTYNNTTGLENENLIFASFYSQSGDEADDLKSTVAFVVILAVVLLIASCMGIINAFNSNLKDRKRQIGMLRTVGATRRQIINIFGREAFIISLIAAPISIVLSYFIVFGISKLLGDSFIFVPDWRVLIACGAFGIVCVMAAAMTPLISASRISPIQSIRNIEYTRKMKKSKISSKKDFVPSALIAEREMIFNKKFQILISFILVFTIFFSCYAFSTYHTEKGYSSRYTPYDYTLSAQSGSSNSYREDNYTGYEQGFSDNDIQKILSSPYVKNVYGAKNCNAYLLIDEFDEYFQTAYAGNVDYFKYQDGTPNFELPEGDAVSEFLIKDYENRCIPIKEKFGYSKNIMPTEIEALYPEMIESLKDYVADGRIDINKLNSGEEIILIAPTEYAVGIELKSNGSMYYYHVDDKINPREDYFIQSTRNIKAGDKITLSVLWSDNLDEEWELTGNITKTDREVTIGAIISQYPDGFFRELSKGFSDDEIQALTTLSGLKCFSSNDKYDKINISLKTDCDEETDVQMKEFLTTITANIEGTDVDSNFTNAQANRKYFNSMFVSILAIIILFVSISSSIINNSMSARIRESRRKIGTMRAVGASVGVVMQSYVRQLLITLGISYAAGFGLFGLFVLIFFISEKIKNYSFTFKVNIWQTIVACLILFAVCSFNLWLKIRKEMKKSIIENIREL